MTQPLDELDTRHRVPRYDPVGAPSPMREPGDPPVPRVRPIRDQVLVQLDSLQTVTPGGIHIPETVRTAQGHRPDARWGTVLAVGPGEDTRKGRMPLEVVPGDRVLVNGWLNNSTTGSYGYGGRDDSDRVVLIQAKDIYAIEESE